MRDDTTIAIQKDTRQRLEDIKVHQRETFDDIVTRILDENFHLEKQVNKLRGKNKKLSI